MSTPSKSVKSVTVKNLTLASTAAATTKAAKAAAAATTKAAKAATKTPALFAPDGKTRVSVEFNAAALAVTKNACDMGEARLALTASNQSMSERMRIVWSFGGFTKDTKPSEAFKALLDMGYLPLGALSGLGASGNAGSVFNLAKFGSVRHPVYNGLAGTHWSQVLARKNYKERKDTATVKTKVSTEAKGLTSAAAALESMPLATDVHVKATCAKFMEMKPALLQRSALLKEMAVILGFSIEGIKSL